MRLGIDIESSGKTRKNLPLSDPNQPRICQIAAIMFDPEWKPVGKLVCLIRPDGWAIEPEAEGIHGISEADCARRGVPLVAALLVLKGMVEGCLQIFAHGARFERDMIQSELERLRADAHWWKRKGSAVACTMELATEPCALPNPGYPGLKFPTLEEALRRFAPDRPAGPTAHEAESDVMDAALVAQGLQREGLWPDFFVPGWKP